MKSTDASPPEAAPERAPDHAPEFAPVAARRAVPQSAPIGPHVGPLSAAVEWTRTLAVGSLLGLIVLGLAWELVLAPTGGRTLALKVLPLAIPLVGLLKKRMYTYRWVSLLIWLYFAEGLIRAISDTGLSALLAGVEVVLCLILFGACAVHVRWRHKLAKDAESAESAIGAAALTATPPTNASTPMNKAAPADAAAAPPGSAAAATPRA